MACHNRVMATITDVDKVKILAKRVADLTSVDQIVYKTICNGRTIFRFSATWKGKAVCTIRFDREHTSETVLRDSNDGKGKSTKPARKTAKRKESKRDME